MDNLRLSRDELCEIINSSRIKTQIDWLSKNKWPFLLDHHGRPVVFKHFVFSKYDAKPAASTDYTKPRLLPNFDSLAV